MKRLLPILLILVLVVVGWTMISAQPAEGARIGVYAGYPYPYAYPYAVRYRAPYYRSYYRPYYRAAYLPVVPYPVYAPPAVYPGYGCVPPPVFVPTPAPCYQVW